MNKVIIKRSFLTESIEVFKDRIIRKKGLIRTTVPVSKITNVEVSLQAPSPFSQFMMIVGRWLIIETTGGKKVDVFLSWRASKEVENEIIKLMK